ncbi:MAG: proline dehydrogenase family protein [Desulfocucumaceae bacterium]
MSLWQKTMIRLALSERVRGRMQGNVFASGLSTRFIGGTDAGTAVQRAAKLNSRGFGTSLYYLGEYVNSPRLIEENVTEIIKVANILGRAGEVHVSVDSSQVGYTVDDFAGAQNILMIGRAVAGLPGTGKKLLMLDMEDFSYVQKTIDIYYRARREGIPAALTLQAYLRRSESDIRRLIERGGAVRLVKGAFVESKERAWTTKGQIRGNYLHLAKLLLSEGAESAYPSFGTHDIKLIEEIKKAARRYSRGANSFEFEMLYGVRPELQRQLLGQGYRVRIYMPFGTQWWPYTIRRVGESPAVLRLVLRALIARSIS